VTDGPMIERLVDRLRIAPVPAGLPGRPDGGPAETVFTAERSLRKASVEDRVFGGQLAAQMLLAAQATVPEGKAVVALHVDYVTFGDREAPVHYRVERTSEARTEVRRVVADQGRVTAVGTFTFQPTGSGFEHQRPMPDVPPPDTVEPHWRMDGRGFRVRTEPGHDPFERSGGDPSFRMWWRTDGPLSDEPGLHEAILAYVGDLTMTAGPFRPLDGYAFDMLDRIVSATVNYAFWFHRPFRMDEWLLHEHSTPSAAGGLALNVSHWHTADGVLVATAAQQTASRVR
jgi:acyl-CoA thioesterase-2